MKIVFILITFAVACLTTQVSAGFGTIFPNSMLNVTSGVETPNLTLDANSIRSWIHNDNNEYLGFQCKNADGNAYMHSSTSISTFVFNATSYKTLAAFLLTLQNNGTDKKFIIGYVYDTGFSGASVMLVKSITITP